ncbi:MAG TPA: hypothetical protein VNJ08_11240 [Bacteriovoracaceae bacterium]|nr:hypothetical protein [Bacteriovoracaceae bacterium]
MRNLFLNLRERITSFLESKNKPVKSDPKIASVPLSGDFIDLETALNPDRESHVKFYTTENAEVAKGAEKAPAFGIDSFGEKDTFDPEESSQRY